MSVSEVYRHVIEDVMKKMAEEFEHNSVSDRVVQTLKTAWEERLSSSGVLPSTVDPYYAQQGYSTYMQPSAVYRQYFTSMGGAARPPSFIPSVTPVWPVQNRDNLPQNDGANDEEDNETVSSNQQNNGENSKKIGYFSMDFELDDAIVQLDGPVGSETEQAEEDSLGPDLDDEDEEPETEDVVLCQFEKVTRIKTKHKCQLKDGIMQLSGRDYHFHKASGEFDFHYS